MPELCPASPPRYLVMHSNPFVSEDLREILKSTGTCVVEVLVDLDEATAELYDVAFLNMSADEFDTQARAKAIQERCRLVVILTSEIGSATDGRDGVIYVSQPFRTEDILIALRSVGQVQHDAE